MKTLNGILLICIVIGLGLLITQKMWVPDIVSLILKYEGTANQSPLSENEIDVVIDGAEVSNKDKLEGSWIQSEVSPQGMQFSYPNPLPTKYVTAQSWPPLLQMTTEEFLCQTEELNASNTIQQKQFQQRTIKGAVYCVGLMTEGAAGSTFTSYEYATKQGDFLLTIRFTLRTPQCQNYDEPEQSLCLAEQKNFDVDTLVDAIASSVRMR